MTINWEKRTRFGVWWHLHMAIVKLNKMAPTPARTARIARLRDALCAHKLESALIA